MESPRTGFRIRVVAKAGQEVVQTVDGHRP